MRLCNIHAFTRTLLLEEDNLTYSHTYNAKVIVKNKTAVRYGNIDTHYSIEIDK